MISSQSSHDSLLATRSLPLNDDKNLRDKKFSLRIEVEKEVVDIVILREVVLKKGDDELEEYGDELGDGCADRARSNTPIGRYGKNVRNGDRDMCLRFALSCTGSGG